MNRKRASDFDQRLLDLFDGYVHGQMDRRTFIERASGLAVTGLGAAALLETLSPDYARAQQVAPDDARIRAERISYPSPRGHGRVDGLLAMPADGGRRGGVVVVHENRGLNPYIEDVARRVALAGYFALAPDGLTSLGGYPGNDDEGRAMQGRLDGAKLREDFFAAFTHLHADARTSGKVGVVGFCYGGSICNAMAVAFPDLAAAVPFYGGQPADADAARIQAPLLLHYAELDTRVNAGWPAFKAALDANQKRYEVHVYPGVNHGFHNDTTPRYDAAAANLAWERTLAFFKAHLT